MPTRANSQWPGIREALNAAVANGLLVGTAFMTPLFAETEANAVTLVTRSFLGNHALLCVGNVHVMRFQRAAQGFVQRHFSFAVADQR